MVTCGPQSNSTRPEWAKDPKQKALQNKDLKHNNRLLS